MAFPTNILQQVQTYQSSSLAYLQNLNCFVATANTKFKNFQKEPGNLGSTVTFDMPPRMIAANSLVASFQSAAQQVITLEVNQAENVSYAFTAQEFIFNVEDYMEKFGKAATVELSASIESNVAEVCKTEPFRFYGDGVTPINSFGQLATALARFRNFGSAKDNVKFYLEDIAQSQIVNSGLNQFALDRNNEMANSWEVGRFNNADFYISSLLPIHTAGTAGDSAQTLTVVSVTKNAADQVTSITFSGASVSDADCVKLHDRFQFNDGVAGQTNMRFRQWTGHKVSSCPVQFRATADAASTAGSQVTVSIYPPLQASSGSEQNINVEIQVGMTCSVMPTHRAGMITGGNPLFLGMPALPDQVPFPTASESDPDTGVSVRHYFGTLFGQNQQGYVTDAIWGKRCVPAYSQAILFPV
jgi:hypothetical protein